MGLAENYDDLDQQRKKAREICFVRHQRKYRKRENLPKY